MVNAFPKIEGTRLILNNGREVSFTYPIKEHLALEEIIVLVLESPYKVIFNENAYGVDYNGNIIWQIEKQHSFPGGAVDCAYVGVHYNTDENTFYLFNFCSLRITIDPLTGRILNREQVK